MGGAGALLCETGAQLLDALHSAYMQALQLVAGRSQVPPWHASFKIPGTRHTVCMVSTAGSSSVHRNDGRVQRIPGIADKGSQQNEVGGRVDQIGVRVVQALPECLRSPTHKSVRQGFQGFRAGLTPTGRRWFIIHATHASSLLL